MWFEPLAAQDCFTNPRLLYSMTLTAGSTAGTEQVGKVRKERRAIQVNQGGEETFRAEKCQEILKGK